MITLLSKELRQLLPIAFLWMALLALSIAIELFTTRIDEQSYEMFCDSLCARGIEYFQAIFLLILCLVTAYSLYPREVDERTIDFLHALPLKKSAIFYSKFFAAFFLICFLLLIGYGVNQLVLMFNPESMSGKKYLILDGSLYVRDCVFAFVVLAHGVFLSRFRTVGLIIYAVYLSLVRWLETVFDGVAWFSVFEIFNIDYAGDRFTFSFDAIVMHIAVAMVLLVVSCNMWSRAKGKSQEQSSSKKSHRFLKVGASVLGFLLMAMFLVGQVMQSTIHQENTATQELSTDHYRFVYRDSDKTRADDLAATAEQHYQQLRILLNATQEPVIHVDMTSENEHAAGLAQWKTIKMGLSGGESPERYARVLNHETAHVFQSVESSRAFRRYFNSTRFFIEGMANYVSFEVVPQSQTRDQNRDIAAVSWHRQDIEFADMTNSAAFSARFNAELVYSLGEIWTEGLVEACGIEALGDVLRAAGRDGAPQDLSSQDFWRNTLQHIGCELEVVNAVWKNKLQTRYEGIDQDLFPVIDDVVAKQAGGNVILTATLPLGSPLSASWFALRVAKVSKTVAAMDSFFKAESVVIEEDSQKVAFVVPSGVFDENRFRYQIGYQIEDGSRIYFQPWRSGSVVP